MSLHTKLLAEKLTETQADRDHYVRLFNRLDAAISHHRKAHAPQGRYFADVPDEGLWNARDKVLADAGARDSQPNPADPPTPVPEHLRPLRGPLGDGDLRIAPSTEELRTIARLLDAERLAGQALITMRDGSPWLEVDIAVPHHVTPTDEPAGPMEHCPACGLELPAADARAQITHMETAHPQVIAERRRLAGLLPTIKKTMPAPPGTYSYAIWRYTGAAYRVGTDGAVEDDPILRSDP